MKASIIIVHYGAFKPTKQCLKSVFHVEHDLNDFEVIVVDNNPENSHEKLFKRIRPGVSYIKSDKNNYCHALNLGIKKAKCEFIVILNPDTIVDKKWLSEILKPFEKDKKLAGVSSKILFSKTRKINSMGIEEIDDYYYRDLDFNEDDNDSVRLRPIKFASGCSVAYRKMALNEITPQSSDGPFDTDFIMYVEDVDMGILLRKAGYKLVTNPKSIVYHAYHGTTNAKNSCDINDLPWFFCNRNRFQIIAKHYPLSFAAQIQKSHPYINKQFDFLYEFIKTGLIKLFKTQNEATIKKVLPDIIKEIADIYPLDKVQNILNYIELYFDLRKPKICLYDHAMQFIGGGQKYGLTIAEAVQNDMDVTLITNKHVTIKDLESWYNLKLNKCSLKIIPLEINKNDKLINPSQAEHSPKNPFAPVEDEVLNHDIFINVNMVPHVNALALKNIFICHFPDGIKDNFFYPDKYQMLVANSKYTHGWIQKKWDLKSTNIVYPPIDMKYRGDKHSSLIKKENIILAVGRFERTGSKKQLEMAKIFCSLYNKYPEILKDWKLVLCGGAIENNNYLTRVKDYVKSCGCPIELITNITNNDLKKLYSKSKIFWHACGLNVDPIKNPNLIEHFGMTTVEAMQNGCVPIVIDGGGQKEIVEQGKNGFRFRNENDLKKHTMNVASNKNLRKKLSDSALESSQKYSKTIFQKTFKILINCQLKKILELKKNIPEVKDATFSLKS